MSETRTAVVTGTSTGFGYQIARKLARDGFTVFGTMRDIAGRNATASADLTALGITVVEADVTDRASVDRAAQTILAAAGHVDVLINNAGTAHFGIAEAFTPESLERQLATNVVGPQRVSRAFLPSMRERKSGLVVFVSSVVGRITLPLTGVYTASKWALEALAETMSYELRPFGVDIAIVEPGAYATNIFNAVVLADDSARNAAYGETAQLIDGLTQAMNGSAGDPAEVSDAIVRLVHQPAGTRPLRTPVPAVSPASAVNAAVEPIQRSVLEAYGFGSLLAPATAVV
jgi:NAD(P)-dependent dehydrogenase (short-subunit alcohol dehydrogenase family)